jgi:hypothetical protein
LWLAKAAGPARFAHSQPGLTWHSPPTVSRQMASANSRPSTRHPSSLQMHTAPLLRLAFCSVQGIGAHSRAERSYEGKRAPVRGFHDILCTVCLAPSLCLRRINELSAILYAGTVGAKYDRTLLRWGTIACKEAQAPA